MRSRRTTRHSRASSTASCARPCGPRAGTLARPRPVGHDAHVVAALAAGRPRGARPAPASRERPGYGPAMTSAMRITAPAPGSRGSRGAPRSPGSPPRRRTRTTGYVPGADRAPARRPLEHARDGRAVEADRERQPASARSVGSTSTMSAAAAALPARRTPGPARTNSPSRRCDAVHAGALAGPVLRGSQAPERRSGAGAPQARRAVAVDVAELEEQIGRAPDGAARGRAPRAARRAPPPAARRRRATPASALADLVARALVVRRREPIAFRLAPHRVEPDARDGSRAPRRRRACRAQSMPPKRAPPRAAPAASGARRSERALEAQRHGAQRAGRAAARGGATARPEARAIRCCAR